MRWSCAGVVLVAIGFSGCATTLVSNYRPGTVVSATVGYPVIDVSSRPKFDGRGVFRRRRLVYGGKSGDTIKLTYQEYLDSYQVTQEVQFDLSKSNKITFQEMRLEVIEATNERLTARVLPADQASSRGEILEPALAPDRGNQGAPRKESPPRNTRE